MCRWPLCKSKIFNGTKALASSGSGSPSKWPGRPVNTADTACRSSRCTSSSSSSQPHHYCSHLLLPTLPPSLSFIFPPLRSALTQCERSVAHAALGSLRRDTVSQLACLFSSSSPHSPGQRAVRLSLPGSCHGTQTHTHRHPHTHKNPVAKQVKEKITAAM